MAQFARPHSIGADIKIKTHADYYVQVPTGSQAGLGDRGIQHNVGSVPSLRHIIIVLSVHSRNYAG